MDRRIVVTDTTGIQAGISALPIGVLVHDGDGGNVASHLALLSCRHGRPALVKLVFHFPRILAKTHLQRIHEINRFNLQDGAGPDGNRAVQQHVPRIPNAPEIVVALAGDQASEQQYGGNDG